jgi:hypothetical protein
MAKIVEIHPGIDPKDSMELKREMFEVSVEGFNTIATKSPSKQ